MFVQGPVGVGALYHWNERPTERLTPVKPKIKLSSYKQKSGGLSKETKTAHAVGARLQIIFFVTKINVGAVVRQIICSGTSSRCTV